jgi:hypothetical protein
MMRSALFLTNTLSWVYIELAHWNNSPRLDMSLHSDISFWFIAYQSLLFLLNIACLEEKQHIAISQFWFDPIGARTNDLRIRKHNTNDVVSASED